MTQEEKEYIDQMSLYDMLSAWRFSPSGTEMFQGEKGKYFSDVMFAKRDANPEEWTKVSKSIGWSK